MRNSTTLLLSGLLLLSASTLAAETADEVGKTVDEVIAKHIEARGGLDAWSQIDNMKVTGDFTAFSKVSPFTQHRARIGEVKSKYHMDHVLDGRQITIGYDGETPWWINLWYGVPWAQKIEGADLKAFMQDVDFESPFFHYQDKGYQVKLLGEGELDGTKAITLELTRPDESVETWYLDPETYLEIGYESEGSDFGRPLPQQAFFDDFREVAGVMLPHYVEKQFYTRLRVMEVAEVETNVEVDDGLFRFPLPGDMGLMQAMAGDWVVKAQQRRSPQATWQDTEATSTIEARMGGALLEERYVSAQGIQGIRSLTYDRFKERYRLAQINSYTSHLDVQEGTFEDGRLTLSNAETDTSWQGGGRTFHQRLSYFDVTPEGFKVEAERSVDGGENWFVNLKATYAKESAEGEMEDKAESAEPAAE